MTKKNKTILIIVPIVVIALVVSLILYLRRTKGKASRLGGKIDDPTLPRNFAEIPGGRGNYRTNQPTLEQFRYIFEKYPQIKTVIRLNKEEGTGVTIEAEKNLVESSGRIFKFVSAHQGYVKGKGYTKSIAEVVPSLKRGHTLIHCTAGADRTGYLVAAYLKDIGFRNWNKEDLWNYTIGYNRWHSSQYICKPGKNWGYIKYLDGFYPINEWCNKKPERKNCEPCI
tara:strand:+ start:332 stop:1009 length:678 start_codon:yes stop_codon:yes gene_type:complete